MVVALAAAAACLAYPAAAVTTTWKQQQPPTSPRGRSEHVMAYHEAREHVVLFGGSSNGVAPTETWTWDGATWTPHSPSPSPPLRSSASMAYDGQRVVLFGGASGGDQTGLDDTWTWDGAAWKPQSPRTSPPPRHGATMAYDGQRVVLFGGASAGRILNDTWTWDGVTWTPVKTPDGQFIPGPPARVNATMANDGLRVVLFGGRASGAVLSSETLADTWTWNGEDGALGWTQRHPLTSPPPRERAAMAEDAARDRVVLFGGVNRDLTNTELGDTWTWDGTTWTAQAPANSPSARSDTAMAAHDKSERVVLFGGGLDQEFRNRDDTWTYPETTNASTPTSTTTTTTPGPSADLSLTMAAKPNPAPVGGDLIYTLTAANAGPDAAHQVRVTDALPEGVSLDSASASQGSCTSSAQTVECLLGTVADQGTATVTIKVTPTRSGTFDNTASVSSATADPDTTDNATTATVTAGDPEGSTTTTSTPSSSASTTSTTKPSGSTTSASTTSTTQPSGSTASTSTTVSSPAAASTPSSTVPAASHGTTGGSDGGGGDPATVGQDPLTQTATAPGAGAGAPGQRDAGSNRPDDPSPAAGASAASAARGSTLARTGGDVQGAGTAALSLMGAGAVLLLAARSRRSSHQR